MRNVQVDAAGGNRAGWFSVNVVTTTQYLITRFYRNTVRAFAALRRINIIAEYIHAFGADHPDTGQSPRHGNRIGLYPCRCIWRRIAAAQKDTRAQIAAIHIDGVIGDEGRIWQNAGLKTFDAFGYRRYVVIANIEHVGGGHIDPNTNIHIAHTVVFGINRTIPGFYALRAIVKTIR